MQQTVSEKVSSVFRLLGALTRVAPIVSGAKPNGRRRRGDAQMLHSRHTCPHCTPLWHLAQRRRPWRQRRNKHTLFTTPSGTFSVCFPADEQRVGQLFHRTELKWLLGPGLQGGVALFISHTCTFYFLLMTEVRLPADIWVYICIIFFS